VTQANKRRPIFVPVVGLDTKLEMNGQVRSKNAAAVVTIQIRKKTPCLIFVAADLLMLHVIQTISNFIN